MARRSPASAPSGAADVDRAGAFRGSYVEFRAAQRFTGAVGRAAVAPLISAFAALAVEHFAQWVAVDVLDESGATVRSDLACADGSGGADALAETAGGLAGVVDRVIASGRTESWCGADGEMRAVVVGLRVKDRAFGAVSFVSGPGREPFGPDDVVVAEEAAWGLGSLLERAVLLDDHRQALRATQRMARQLHQLFAATVAVSGAHDEAEVATTVVQSARRVFDADLAVIDLEGTAAWIERGSARATLGRCDVEGVPVADGVALVADDWLAVPITGRDAARYGTLAIRRREAAFSGEDVEIGTLLAQAAATALGARALTRGIERSEARQRALVEAAPIGIVEVSDDGAVRWWNRAAERVLGWPAPGEGAQPRFPAALATAVAELAAEARALGGPALRDLVDIEVRGRARDLTTAAAPVELPDATDGGLMLLIDDVTDHRQLKAEVAHAQQMELRGRVASTVAHDFNNLITLITGYAEILSREVGDERLATMATDIQATASRASRLTAQLQSIGRSPALDPVVLSPADVVRANAEVLERVVGREVEVELALDDEAGAIRVDAAQFEQMILNLALNARDAMPDGGRLRVGVSTVEIDEPRARTLGVEPGSYVAVSVSDTGTGMDEETMAHCFDAFFTTKGPLRGTGMGLASARRLAEASGGAITVASTPGAGTTFEALFPHTREAVVVELAGAAPRRARGFATVLVVDDDGGLRRLMTQVLSRNGHQVLEAESGEEALEMAERYEGVIDVLVCDVDLGGMSGPEVAAALQGRRPGLRVLLISGTAHAAVVDGLAPGSAAFLAKPFRPSVLIDGVSDLLVRRDDGTAL